MASLRITLLFTIGCMLAFTGCAPENSSSQSDALASPSVNRLNVMVSIAPQRYFVERIGAAYVTVSVVSPPDYSPETYQVTPRQMDALGNTDIYFLIGMPFEDKLVSRISETFPQVNVIDTREGVPLLEAADHTHHESEDTHHHHHQEDKDPHIWLDPMRVKIQARTIANALASVLPEHEAVFAHKRIAFERELDALHSQLINMLAPVRGRVLYVFHPSFGYFADAYGLEQRAVEFEGKSPGARRLYALMDEIKQSGVGVLFEQPQFKASALKTIADETGVEIVILDVLAEEYIENMKLMAAQIVTHLQAASSGNE